LYAVCDEISELPAGSRVLDLPCGGGVALRGLRSGQRVTYVAADIAPEMLARTMDAARARGVDHLVSPTRADAGALGFDDASYDLVVSLTGLHCFPDPEAAVHELARVLRSGGRLVGSAFCVDAGLLYLPGHRIGRALGVLGPPVRSTEMRSWLVAAGLVDVRLDRAGALTYFEGTRA
ncbi:methyltransferase domain-containing protein, partial [Aeromicrobium sp. REDSEA-S32_B7]|uniref:class I SAM-dependent methyltransferase n=1 Tax=Aeromicrobium sp. REDSEA-S32_B7 TaxID=1811526 RepID=UPI000AEA5DA5